MEEEIKMAETEQGDVASNVGKTSVEMPSSSPIKRGRGRPQGSKKLKVCITDVNLTQQVSNGGSKQSTRGRGRPKLTKDTVQEGSGDNTADNSVQTLESNEQASNEDSPTAEHSPKKRGRPRNPLSNSTSENADAKDLLNGGSDTPRARRGRPKGSLNRKSERGQNEGSSVMRRRQRGSLNKKPRLETEVSSGEEEEEEEDPVKKRGRPKKKIVEESENSSSDEQEPRKQPAKRGRPRKYPLPSPEELKKSKVWKPLGRPRKYPRADPPEESQPAPRRSRGRPFKSESKKGAHLRKSLPASSPRDPNVGSPRKRGRPPSATKSVATPKSDATPTRKTGRPKGSLNRKKAGSETKLEDPNHSEAESDSSPDGVKHEAEAVEEELEPNTETSIQPKEETPIEQLQETPTEHGDNTEESLISQDAGFEVSNQA